MRVRVELDVEVALALAHVCAQRGRAALGRLPDDADGTDPQVRRALRVARAYAEAGGTLVTACQAAGLGTAERRPAVGGSR